MKYFLSLYLRLRVVCQHAKCGRSITRHGLLLGVDALRLEERRNRVVLSVKHQQLGRAPLSTFGDGLRRIFTLAIAIPQCKNGFLLIGELETSIHTKALRGTFERLVKACIENNVQLFATTHSLETIDAVIDACKDDIIDLVAYRLEQGGEQTRTTRFDKELLTRLREELGMDNERKRIYLKRE
ncbi:MAG TPA: AAA family ATPase [Ktedonobacteraceae bacterium]